MDRKHTSYTTQNCTFPNLPSFDPSKQKSNITPNVWRFKNISKNRPTLKNMETKLSQDNVELTPLPLFLWSVGMLVMCVSFGLGWILSRANLKDVFVYFEDLKSHGLTDVLAVMRHHLTFIWAKFSFVLECYVNNIFKFHRYINVYWFSPLYRSYIFKCSFYKELKLQLKERHCFLLNWHLGVFAEFLVLYVNTEKTFIFFII